MHDFIRVVESFELLHGQARSLRLQQAGLLRVNNGRVWATVDNCPDDYFLSAGDTLDITAGAHLVVETWNQNKEGVAQIDWLEVSTGTD